MDAWHWPITPFDGAPLPSALVTRRAFDAEGALDAATALILPSGGIRFLPEEITALAPARPQPGVCLGLWLGVHHLPGRDVLSALAASGLGWVSNFPAASMFGDGFGQQLAEVGMGAAEECAALAQISGHGLKVVRTLTPSQDPALAVGADAVLVVLRSADDLKLVAEGFAEELRAAAGPRTPFLIHGGRDGHLPHAPEALGFSGVMAQPIAVPNGSPLAG